MARGPLSLFSQPVTAHPKKAARLSGLSRQRFSALAHRGGISIQSTRLLLRGERPGLGGARPSQFVESPRGLSPPSAPKSVREPLDSEYHHRKSRALLSGGAQADSRRRR